MESERCGRREQVVVAPASSSATASFDVAPRPSRKNSERVVDGGLLARGHILGGATRRPPPLVAHFVSISAAPPGNSVLVKLAGGGVLCAHVVWRLYRALPGGKISTGRSFFCSFSVPTAGGRDSRAAAVSSASSQRVVFLFFARACTALSGICVS